MSLRVLSHKNIYQALSMRSAIETMREIFPLLTRGEVVMPSRVRIDIDETMDEGGMISAFMPAYIRSKQNLGIKVVTLRPDNKKHNQAMINGALLLICHRTGQIKAILEGAALTALKTGASGGLATDLLSREDAATLAIIGAGTQNEALTLAACTVRKITEIKVFSRNYQKTLDFIDRIKKKHLSLMDISISAVREIQQATLSADIVNLATNSEVPVISESDVKSGVHINAIGGHNLNSRETSRSLIEKATVFVEQTEATHRESCEVDVVELGSVVAGLAGRQDSEQITIYASVGVGAQDVYIGEKILQAALQQEIGQSIAFHEL